MKHVWIIATLALLFLFSLAYAQLEGIGDVPVEITADGETHFEKGLAIADDNVQIHFQDVSIYCDHAEYNPENRDVLLIGNVRIYSPDGLVTGQRALYNLQEKQMRALNFSGSYYPMAFRAVTFRSLSQDEFRVRGADLTTDDKSPPDYHIKAKTMRIYRSDRVVFLYSTLYVGRVPIFWFPYLYSSMNNTGFSILPGYYAGWGGFVQLSYGFGWGENAQNFATGHFDYRYNHGIALGLDSSLVLGENPANQGFFRSYWAYDTNPTKGVNSINPINTPHNRYRITYNQHFYLVDDIYATCDLNKLSDANIIQDFFPVEYRTNPQPDNNISLTKWNPNYTLNLLTRFQANTFQQTVERLPELALDIKQNNIFGLPIYFDSTHTIGYLQEAFGKRLLSNDPRNLDLNPTDFKNKDKLDYTTRFPNYAALRFDSFNQISLPKTYFGWLSIVPRLGFRATTYSRSGVFYGLDPSPFSAQNLDLFMLNPLQLNGRLGRVPPPGAFINPKIPPRKKVPEQLERGGSIFRPVVNFEIESSFKLSHAYERAQSRFLGIDGLMHVIQPYVDYSFVQNFGPKARNIYQFDTVQFNAQPLPISFPDFQAIDAIDSWSILRSGIRNNLITRRDDGNYQWVTLDTFFDYNFFNPYTPLRVGNLNNYLRFYPSRWFSIYSYFQVPLDKNGFTQFDTAVSIMPFRNFQFSVSHTYLDHYPEISMFGNFPNNHKEFPKNKDPLNKRVFQNISQVTLSAYYRLNDNWACSAQEQFNVTQGLLLYQRYMVHRDLSSWVASLGMEVRQNEGQKNPQFSVVGFLTLKGAPQVHIPMAGLSSSPMGPGSSR